MTPSWNEPANWERPSPLIMRRKTFWIRFGTITSKRGVDLVVDSVGEKTWLQSLKMVSKGGRIVTCGATTGPNPRTEIRLIFWKQISILGSTMSNVTEFNRVVKLLGQGQLQPVIDSVLPLEQGPRSLLPSSLKENSSERLC